MLSFGEAWSATLAFTFQLFCDFSGYTEMRSASRCCSGCCFRKISDGPTSRPACVIFGADGNFAVEFHSRLSLHPARRQPCRPVRYVVATWWAMGICGLCTARVGPMWRGACGMGRTCGLPRLAAPQAGDAGGESDGR